MKWTLSQLQKYRNKEFLIDETIRMDELKADDPEIRDISPIHVTGHADIDSAKVTFHLTIEGYFVLPCSRTLVDVHYPIHIETTETFLTPTAGFEVDEDAYQVKGDTIDLKPVLRELLLLEIPMQVFCEDVNSEEAAPQSGNDWEVIREEDRTKRIDPRLAGLVKFFDENNSSSDS